MWTEMKSLKLSRILAAVFTAMIVLVTFFVPSFSDWYDEASVGNGLIDGSLVVPACVTLYVCEAFAFAAVISLHILLKNISVGEVFVTQNTKCLRVISWACMLAGVAFLVMALWRFIFLFPAFFVMMFGLVMRVLKNVFEQAVEINSENDFTV
jgi:hypothetical protein